MNTAKFTVLLVIGMLFVVVLLVIGLYILWLRSDFKKRILQKEENWFAVDHDPISISHLETKITASITFRYKNSICIQALSPHDKLWKEFVRHEQAGLETLPIEESLEVCVDGSHVVAYRKQGDSKHHRFAELAAFVPALGPPNPLSFSIMQKERKVSLGFTVLSVPTGIIWLFLIFTILLRKFV